MRVTLPVSITDAMLTSSTAIEPGAAETAWVSGTTYAVGDVRIRTQTHRKYERLIAGAGTTAPENDTTNWEDIGPTNKWAMFDLERNTQTEYASPLTVVVALGERSNTLGILGMVADHIYISATSVTGGGSVYSYDEDLTVREVLDHYMYAFEPFSTRPSKVVFNLPPFSDLVVTVTLTRATGNVKCGSFVQGTFVYVGKMLADPESDVVNFSKVDRDEFGTATLVPRRSIPKTNQVLLLEKSRVNNVYAVRTALNAVPALWTGLDDDNDGYFEILLILGIYKRFTINATHPVHAKVNLEVEEI